MSSLDTLAFDNSFARLHPAFYQVVDPTPLPNPELVAFNPDAARLLDLDPDVADRPDTAVYLSGGGRLPGSEPIAMLYAGHQFGVWVPELGDGRAILLGEVVNHRGERWDLHLKGSGLTRFSRMGDGRAVLRSCIREYLASEAMFGLGIPPTRALSIVGSDEVVYREIPESGAALVRLATSHIRFGTFQVFASRHQTDRVRELADYVIARHQPDLVTEPDRFRRWLVRVVEQTADLVAQWMAVGFAHGVLNTDNMSVIGLTLDYGPFGWLDQYDPSFICNHSDHEGRYAFDRQPAVALWNLTRFAESLLSLITVEEATEALELFPDRFNRRYGELLRAKLGLTTEQPSDLDLIAELLGLLRDGRADYTRFFRALGSVPSAAVAAPESLRLETGDSERLDRWITRWMVRLTSEGAAEQERACRMNRVNPKYVLRNYLAQRAIDLAHQGDFTEIERLRQLLADPFADQPELERYAEPPPPWAREIVVSCSS
jgi:uncharacterized protein YdiU (UPF0061 family)